MKVTATRTGDWWALEADFAGQPVYTQARRLDQAEAMVRDAFAMLDVDLGDESVEVVAAIAPDIDHEVAAAVESSQRAVTMNRLASDRMRVAVSQLRGRGFTVRDVATVLRVSPQRISQLEASVRSEATTVTGKFTTSQRPTVKSGRTVKGGPHTRA